MIVQGIADDDTWDPISVTDVANLLARLSIPWWVAGGWAIDLFLGETVRGHEDTDVLILRRDQLALRQHLSGWQMLKTHQPGLAPWPDGEFLHPPVNSIWVRRDEMSAWSFEVMLMETEEEEWVYRRCPVIRGAVPELGMPTDSGIPFLRPEIQLLYKAREGYADKDLQDLRRTLPHLGRAETQWLLDCLRLQYPGGHEWICYVEGAVSGGNAWQACPPSVDVV